MQNKGAITLLAVALALVSLYQLFFTYKTNQVEKAARVFAQGDPGKEKVYLDSIANQPVYNFLGIAKFTYKECKELELNLGLDLKGGMNVTMEVDVADVVRSLANHSADPAFNQAINEAIKMRVSSPKDFVTLFGEAFEKIAPGAQLASPAIFGTHEMKEKIKIGATNKEVLDIIRKEADGAIDNTFNILRTRIDRFGVAQPNIRKADISGRIVIELPGIKDPQRVRELLQGTAALEFYETYDNPEYYQYLEAANNKLREVLEAQGALTESTKATPEGTEAAQAKEEDKESAILSALKEGQDSSANASESEFFKNNPLFAVLQPNITQQGPGNGSTVGYALVKDTSKVNKYLAMPQVRAMLPRNSRLLWEMKSVNGAVALHAIKITTRNGKAPLEGDAIVDARKDFDQSGAPVVSMNMNGEGTKTWARLTKENIGHCIAIVLDGLVASSPNVNDEIKGGSSQISGRFDVKEAEDLANILKSGKLPAPARIIADEVVGPSLGQEAIQSGMWSFIIAFTLVLAYMLFFYSKNAGLAADIALFANLFFLFGILASIGAVLTLPGIAGIVLTMGMAVDANVLIYERIQEELRSGKGLKLAIKEGYNNAYSAIIDGNLTTLLTGFILYYFGEGPIKGFATTLIIGILSSLFTAIFITRLILERAASKSDNVTFATSATANWLRDTKFPFLSKRKISYTLSGVVILICFISLFTRGLDKGIDFVGGRTYTVSFNESVRVDDVASSLEKVYGSAPEVKTFGTANQVKITTKYKIDENGAEVDAEVDSLLYVGLQEYIPAGTDYPTFRDVNLQMSQKIGPAVAEDMTRAAIWSIIFALIGIFLYIMIRFSKWQYGAGAVVGLAHNTIIVIGMFSLFAGILPFSLEVDQAFIAAILTVVGYSINDTVVVFDRIREYRRLYPKRDDEIVVNDALNSTLRRTFSTSLSTIVVLLAIFIFGGASIKGFIFALLVGIIVGTYSSLFIATPISFDLTRRFAKKEIKGKE
ncbi:protein translocase subunit SecDF [uncultured Sanguibacteroides sp.]|uniref:protein translocase subunit SecDF n=1 Tax=uncultured Sanguibacteroides sp. TaxID=1635151 RepID=UPI0025F7B92D|nr:protein translocase subunit SecDF [uncultured Sanguibacteroides sp.]